MQAQQEKIVLDTVENADGLEQLVVICVDLDAPVERNREDLQTRSRLYRGLTRAQLLAIVVNARVQGGWLEFLGMVTFSESADETVEEKESVQNIQAAAAKANEEALQIVETPNAGSADVDKSAQPDDSTQKRMHEKLMHETSTVFGYIQQRETAFLCRSTKKPSHQPPKEEPDE